MFILPRQVPAAQRRLVSLLRAAVAAPDLPEACGLGSAFEMGPMTDLVRRHRVAGLIHRGIAEGRIEEPLPGTFTGVCREVYFDSLRRNIVSLETAGPAIRDLAGHGISVSAVHAWALLTGQDPVYGDAGVRPLGDLDLVLPRRDVPAARRILESHDFLPLGSAPPPGGGSQRFQRIVAGVELSLRLHWGAIAEDGPLSLHDGAEHYLSELCEPGSSAGRPRSPSRIGHLLAVASLAARHSFGRWIWLADIHQLVGQARVGDAFDWPLLERAASSYRLSCAVYTGLSAARELYGTCVPQEVLDRMAPGRFRRGLLLRTLVDRNGGSRSRRRASRLLMGDSWWDVVRGAVPLRPGVARTGAPNRGHPASRPEASAGNG